MVTTATGTLTFKLNGNEVQVPIEPGESLLRVLRDRLGVTSPKDGCAPQGHCGCCTVLINGLALMSCLQKAEKMEGRSVVTMEGLDPAERDVLARSLVESGGAQCGFCIPGILMKARALFAKDPEMPREQLASRMNSHLCRCTGYAKILDGLELAGRRWPERASFVPSSGGEDGVGGRSAKYQGHELSVGAKDFIDDMVVPDMLVGVPVFSPHPRARLLRLGLDAARAVAGVEGILTAADVPGNRNVGLLVADWPIFVAEGEETRCVGDILALVVACDRRTAEAAAALVEMDWEVLTPLTDCHEALKPEAPVLHPQWGDSNGLKPSLLKRGDLEAARAASVHILQQTFHTQRIEHAFLEPESCLAMPEAEGVRVFTQGQGVHSDRRQIASVLGLPLEMVKVRLVSNGGAFGGKEDLSIQAQTALAAHVLQRPVKVTLTRDASIRLHPKRHPIEMDYTVGADAEGRLKFVKARMIGDTGAYLSVGTKVLERASGHSCGPYKVEAVDVEARAVYTNNPPCGAFRGFGANQAAFAIETMLDLLAERVGIDGYDIRERNILDPGGVFATGQILDESCGIRETLESVRDDYKAARYAGIACAIKNTGIGNGRPDIGRVLIRVLEGPQVVVSNGYTEMGQGLFTVLAQIVHEETGIARDLIEVETCTEFAVECGMTTASRATVLGGMAAREAGKKLAMALITKPLEALVGCEFPGSYICDFTTSLGKGGGGKNPVTHLTFGYATQVVLLDEQGRLQKVIAAHDVGRAINPTLCEGQIEGAIVQGLGYALTEDLPCPDGVPASTRLNDLGLLRAKHVPEIEVRLIEVPDRIGPYGAKGVGEIGLVPTAPAVASALFAFDGERRFRLPMRSSPAAQAIRRDKKRKGGARRSTDG